MPGEAQHQNNFVKHCSLFAAQWCNTGVFSNTERINLWTLGSSSMQVLCPKDERWGEGGVWLRQRVWADMGVLTRRNPSFSPSSLTSNPLFFLSLSHCIWICDATKGNGCCTLSSVGSSDKKKKTAAEEVKWLCVFSLVFLGIFSSFSVCEWKKKFYHLRA